jgi:hypothetical protein
MKLFRKKEEQKKKAQARQLLKLQKDLEKIVMTGMADISDDMRKLVTEFNEALKEAQEIIPLMDQEIKERQFAGEDTSGMEQTREELIQSMDEVKNALAAVPASPFTA